MLVYDDRLLEMAGLVMKCSHVWKSTGRRIFCTICGSSKEQEKAMHDRTGKPLKKGDKVTILCVITDLQATPDYCNVSLETEYGRRPDGLKERISAINTGVMDKVD